MGTKSNYLENKLLDGVLRNTQYTVPTTVYSALFTVIPSAATGGTEVTNASSGYTRVATTFCTAGATAAGQSVNVSGLTFVTAAAAYTVVGWAVMDAITAGNLLYWATVTTIAFAIGDQATIAVGGAVVTEA